MIAGPHELYVCHGLNSVRLSEDSRRLVEDEYRSGVGGS